MLITVKVPEHNVQRLRLKVGDGMIVNKSKLSQDRFYGEIVDIKYQVTDKLSDFDEDET